MAVWPFNSETKIETGSWNESPPDNTIRSKMEVGPEKIRRRTTANIRPVSFIMNLNDAELDILDEFYTNDTFSGADEFDYIHPRTSDNVKARFADKPSYNDIIKGVYKVNISLEILP